MHEPEKAPPVLQRRRDMAKHAASSVATSAFDLAFRAGPVPLAFVGVGGVALAALLWDNAGGDTASDVGTQIGVFVVSAAIALCVAFGTWLATAYAANRFFGWDELAVTRWDGVTYVAFLAFPIARLVAGTDAPVAGWATLFGFLIAKLVPLARFVPAVRDVVLVYSSTRIVVFLIGAIATAILPTAPGHANAATPFAAWAQWDGAHYLAIAGRGYGGTDIAFFPLYPTLVRIGGAFFRSDVVAAVVISNVAFLAGLWFLRDIALRLTGNENTAGRALWYLAIFPASLFFTAVYSESVFFALTVATFANLDRRNWLFAGILGGFAALTRLAGVFLIVPFLIEIVAVMRTTSLASRANRRQLIDLLACAACIPLALLSFMVLEGILTGDILAFEHVQSHWQRALSPPWISVWRSIELVATSHDRATIAVQAIELTFTALVVVLLVDGFRMLRASYWWYAVLSFLVPLSTSSLMSVPRFAAVVFPLFIVLAVRGEDPLIDRLVVAFSLPLLGLFTAFFVTGRWVA